jgi:hypothetical protein
MELVHLVRIFVGIALLKTLVIPVDQTPSALLNPENAPVIKGLELMIKKPAVCVLILNARPAQKTIKFVTLVLKILIRTCRLVFVNV